MKHLKFIVGAMAALAALPWPLFAEEETSTQVPPGAKMSFLENGQIKVGVDLTHGGAVVFLAKPGGRNLINNFDLGRQVQLSFFSGPVPFRAEGQEPAKHWSHLGWNPIQSGDDFKNPGRLIAHENDGRILHVKSQPLQWPLNNVPGECTFDSWLELEGPVVKARALLSNARSDHTQYPARLQELPAVYANAAFHRVVSYTGASPFTGDAVTEVPQSTGRHPWTFWHGTENWSALLNADNQGLGLVTPGRIFFTGGFAGKPGPNDPFGNATGYLAGQALEILDHNISFEFRYELVAGSLEEIRARATAVRSPGLPAWTFSRDRQGWHHVRMTDQGWPIRGMLDLTPQRDDPQLISPFTFWQAEEAPFLLIEAACSTPHGTGTVYWQHLGEESPGATDHLDFPLHPDGKFHLLSIRLADKPSYRGPMIRLRLDPVPVGSVDDRIRIKTIRLSKTPQ